MNFSLNLAAAFMFSILLYALFVVTP